MIPLREAVPLLRVADVSRSIEWYEKMLGFKAHPFFEPPYVFAVLTLGGTRIMLKRIDGYQRDPKLDGWDAYLVLVGQRLREVYAELVAKAADIAMPLQRMPYGDCEFEIRDPDGNLLCISELLDDASGVPEVSEGGVRAPIGLASDEKFEAVIFDLYGTLVDFSLSAYQKSLAEMREALDAPGDFAPRFQAAFPDLELGAISLEEALAESSGRAVADTAPEAMEKATLIWQEAIRLSLTPRPGVIDLLKRLKDAGCGVGLISNTMETVAALWDETAFAPYVDAPVFSCRAGLRKPDWRIYTLACDLLSLPASECLFVGDGSSGELSGAEDTGMTAAQLRVEGEDPDVVAFLGREDWQGPVISLAEIAAFVAGPA